MKNEINDDNLNNNKNNEIENKNNNPINNENNENENNKNNINHELIKKIQLHQKDFLYKKNII